MSTGEETDSPDPRQRIASGQATHAHRLYSQFMESGEQELLDEAIEALETAIELTSGSNDAESVIYMRMIEMFLLQRWDASRNNQDLERILSRRQIIDTAVETDSTARTIHQTMVATALQERYELFGAQADIDEAVHRWENAVAASSDDDPLLEMRQAGLERARLSRSVMTDELMSQSLEESSFHGNDPLQLSILALGHLMRFRAGGPRSEVDQAISLLEQAIAASDDTDDRIRLEYQLGTAFADRFLRNKLLADLERAIELYGSVVSATGRNNEQYAERVRKLINAHYLRVQVTSDLQHIEETIKVLRRHVDDEGLDLQGRGQIWSGLCSMLQNRARSTRRWEDLESAIEDGQAAVMATEGSSAHGAALSTLATSLGLAFELFRDRRHLRESASVASAAVDSTEASDPAFGLRLFNAAHSWFMVGDQEQDLECFDRALLLLDVPSREMNEQQPQALLRMQIYRITRYRVSKDPADLDAAIDAGLYRQQLPTRLAQGWQESLRRLSDALRVRAMRTRSLTDFDLAMRCATQLLDGLSEDDPHLPLDLYYLRARIARDRFDVSSDIADLDLAIASNEQALRISRTIDETAQVSLTLCEDLRRRFSETHDESDFRKAATQYQELLRQLPEGHPSATPCLLELSNVTAQAYSLSHDVADARASIGYAREALQGATDEPDVAIRARLAICELLTIVSGDSPDIAELDEAVEEGESAIAIAAGHSLLPRALLSLAEALWQRYLRNNNETDFRRGVEVLTELGERSEHDKTVSYSNSARFFRRRFRLKKHMADIDHAIELLQQAMALISDTSPLLGAYASELRACQQERDDDGAVPKPPHRVPTVGNEVIGAIPVASRWSPEDRVQWARAHAQQGDNLVRKYHADNDPATIQAAITAYVGAALVLPDQFTNGLAAALFLTDDGTEIRRTINSIHLQVVSSSADDSERREAAVALMEYLYFQWHSTYEQYALKALHDMARLLAAADIQAPEISIRSAEALTDLFVTTGDESTVREAMRILSETESSLSDVSRQAEVSQKLERARALASDPLIRISAQTDLAWARYMRCRDLRHVEELVAATKLAASETPAKHPARAQHLINLANATVHHAQIADEDEEVLAVAVTAARRAVEETTDRALLATGKLLLSVALLLNLRRSRSLQGAEEVVEVAGSLLADPDRRIEALTVLAEVLIIRYEETRDTPQQADLHQAVAYAREAVEGTSSESPNRDTVQGLLIQVLFARFLALHDEQDLIEALGIVRTLALAGSKDTTTGLLAALLAHADQEDPLDGQALLDEVDAATAESLAEVALDIAMAIQDDRFTERLLALPAYRAGLSDDPVGRERFLIGAAQRLADNGRSPLALKLLRNAADHLATAEELEGEAYAWSLIGSINEDLEEWEHALEALDNAAALYGRIGNQHSEVLRISDMGVISTKKNDPRAAIAFFDRATQLARNADLGELEANNLALAATAHTQLDDPSSASQCLLQASSRFTALGLSRQAANTWAALALLSLDLRDAPEAARQAAHAVELADEPETAKQILLDVAASMIAQGFLEEARAVEDRFVELERRDGETHDPGDARYAFGKRRRAVGDLAGALEAFEAARAEYAQTGDPDRIASADTNLGVLYFAGDQVDRAINCFRAAAARFNDAGYWAKAAMAYRDIAMCLRNARATEDADGPEGGGVPERRDEAAAELATALALAVRSDDPEAIFEVRLEQARLDADADRLQAANEHLAAAQGLAVGDTVRQAMIHEEKARQAERVDDLQGQIEALERAVDLFREAEMQRSAANASLRLGLALEERGDLSRARSALQFAIDHLDAPSTDSRYEIVDASPPVTRELLARVGLLSLRLGDERTSQAALASAARLVDRADVNRWRLSQAVEEMREAEAAGDLARALVTGQQALSETDDPSALSILLIRLSQSARELGKFELAYDYATRGIELAIDESDPSRVTHVTQLGAAARALGRIDEAVMHLSRAADMAARLEPKEPGIEAEVLNSFALALIDQGAWSEADRILTRGLVLAQSANQRRIQASLLSSQASLCLRREDLDGAFRGYREAIQIMEQLGGDPSLAGEYANLALVHAARGEKVEARALTERALEKERAAGQLRGVVLNLMTLANLEDDHDVQTAKLIEALTISREIGFLTGEANALNNLGAIELDQEDAAGAHARFSEAISIYEEMHDGHHLSSAYHNRSNASELLGDLGAALADSKEACRLQELLWAGKGSPSSTARMVRDRVITLAAHAQLGADVWTYVEQGKAQRLTALLGLHEWPSPPGVSPETVAQERRILSEVRDFQSKVVNTRDPSRRKVIADRLASSEKELDRLWAELGSIAPDYVASRRATAPTTEQLNRLVASGKIGLLGFHVGESEITVLVHRSGLSEPIAYQVMGSTNLLEAFGESQGRPVPVILQLPDGRRGQVDLWQFFADFALTEALEVLGEDLDLLYLLPHRSMHHLPLHALAPGGRILLDRFPIAYAPSVGVLTRLAARSADSGHPSQLVVGYTPNLSERQLIEGEATDVAALLGTAPHLGGGARRDLLTGSRNIVHLSCHGVFDEHDPFGSGIRLADGLLTAREIMSLRIQADLVVLSACETALSGDADGDDVAGLGHALLYAGARSAVLTLWPVDARVTRDVMNLFYTNLLAGQNKAAALRQAVLDLRDRPGCDDPAIWAAYLMFGQGR